jgi:hypothetical protein
LNDALSTSAEAIAHFADHRFYSVAKFLGDIFVAVEYTGNCADRNVGSACNLP